MATGSPYRHQLLCSKCFFFFWYSANKTCHGQRGTAAWWQNHPMSHAKIHSYLLAVTFCSLFQWYLRRLHFILSFFSSKTFFCRHTSTSRRPSGAPGVAMLMSKQVTIMTWDLHRLTQNSSSSVACAKASRYSEDSLSKLWSTSTVGKK